MKRLTCLILILTLLLGLGLPAVHAADVQIRDQVSHTNPLYPQVTENVPVTAPRLEADESGDIVYATSLEEAAVILRAQLEQRLATCVVHLAIPEYDRQQAHDVFRLALAHTGVPTQGDYLLWQYQSYSCSITGTGSSAGYELNFTYTLTYYTSPAQEAAVDAAVEDLLEDLALEGKSDYDAVLAIYDYITDHVTYDYVSDDTYLLQYTAYGALINGTSVCQGYAVLFYRLALECGIDTRLIAGTGGGGAHGWNIVELDGLYYDLDATWDAGRSEYNYFLRCEANFPDHRRYEEYDTAEFHAAYPMAQKDYRPNSQTPHTHQYTVDCVVPTCTKEGYTTTTCVTCGMTQTETLPAMGHTYEDGKCVTCGEPDPSYVVLSAPVITSCYSKEQTSVKVTWTAVDGADGYQIYRSTSPDGSTGWQSVKTVKDGKQTSYTNQNLTVGVTYYYKVRAYVQNGEEQIYSDFSEVKFMPAAVVWDGPYSNATFRIRLRWDAVGSAHGYQIWRQNADGSWSVVKTLGDRGNTLTNDQGDVTAYSNTGLTAGGKYTYKMRAFYISPEGGKIYGAYSDEITVSLMPETPVVTVTSPKAERAQVKWTVDSAADGYQVWMSEKESSGFSIAKSVTGGDTLSYTKSGLESGKTYYFKVRAYSEVDGKKTFGAYSETIAITVK